MIIYKESNSTDDIQTSIAYTAEELADNINNTELTTKDMITLQVIPDLLDYLINNNIVLLLLG